MRVDGREVLLFAGSNYLDLAHHPELVEASARATREFGCAAGGSRLINGNLRLHEELEEELAKFLGADAALAFATGYMANVGLIPALVGEGDVVVSDALAHASIIDGCRLSRAAVRVFPHGDLDALEQTLREVASTPPARAARARRRLQHGRRHRAAAPRWWRWHAASARCVLLDDAHGTGTLGAGGRGTPEHCGVREGIDILVGHARQGARQLRRLRGRQPAAARAAGQPGAQLHLQLRARARAGGGRARALALVQREPWRRERLQRDARRLRAALARSGISTAPSTTQIVPVVIGENARTMAVCERLLERGFYTQGIRYPSVPEGTRAPAHHADGDAHRRRDRRARAGRRRGARAGGASAELRAQRARSEPQRASPSGFFVTGTDTGVGKTVVACALLRGLRARGRRRRRDEADRDRRGTRRAARRDGAARGGRRGGRARDRLPAALRAARRPDRRRGGRGAPRRPRRGAARLRGARGAPRLSRRRGRGRPARARGRGREHGGPGGRARAPAAGGGAREPRHHQPHPAHAGGRGRARARARRRRDLARRRAAPAPPTARTSRRFARSSARSWWARSRRSRRASFPIRAASTSSARARRSWTAQAQTPPADPGLVDRGSCVEHGEVGARAGPQRAALALDAEPPRGAQRAGRDRLEQRDAREVAARCAAPDRA